MDTYGVFGSKVMGANEVGTGSRECVAEMSWASDQDMELFGSRKDDCCQYKKVDLCCKNVLNMLCILSFFLLSFLFSIQASVASPPTLFYVLQTALFDLELVQQVLITSNFSSLLS